MFYQFILIPNVIGLLFLSTIYAQRTPLCDSLNDIEGTDDNSNENNADIKSRGLHALCDAIHSSQAISDNEGTDLVPELKLSHMNSGIDF